LAGGELVTTWVYGVYAIQLRASYGPRDHPHLPALYVGSSHYTPEERFRQHRDGYAAASRQAGPDVWRLRPELYEDVPLVYDRYEAERLERERALRLAEAEFTVRSDGEVPRVPPDRLRPFDAVELARVEDLFDRAAFAVVARGVRPLRFEEVAAILLDAPTVNAASIIHTPCDEVRRFTHVGSAAVVARLREIVERGWLTMSADGTLGVPTTA
jgi:hypothetical protein